jgi:hypothetical protein
VNGTNHFIDDLIQCLIAYIVQIVVYLLSGV